MEEAAGHHLQRRTTTVLSTHLPPKKTLEILGLEMPAVGCNFHIFSTMSQSLGFKRQALDPDCLGWNLGIPQLMCNCSYVFTHPGPVFSPIGLLWFLGRLNKVPMESTEHRA